MKNKPRLKIHGGMSPLQINSAYEGATRSYRMKNKGLNNSGPNQDIKASHTTLVKRSRHAVQNHPIAVSAIENYTTNMIGTGITAKWPNEDVQGWWDIWVNQCDADGVGDFAGMQTLITRSQFEAGEGLARRRVRLASDGLEVPLQVQLLDPDRLDVNHNDFFNGRNVVMGIEFNGVGKRSAYHLWRHHPSENNSLNINERVPVPAVDIAHLYRRLRPEQKRGIPEMTAVLIKLYEIDEMQDSTLMRQKAAALFSIFVRKKSENVNSDFPQDSNTLGEDHGQITEAGTPISEVVTGGIHYLDEDEDVVFANPPDIGSNYSPWMKSEYRLISRVVHSTYEQLTNDLEGTSYSSIRSGLIEVRRWFDQQQKQMIIFGFCQVVAGWFLDQAVISGKISLPNYWKNRQQYLPKWFTPKWEWVDPLKDAMADLIEVRAGFSSREEKVAERNGDINRVDEQLNKEQKSDLVLDSNPSKTSKAGQLHQQLAEALILQE